MKIKILFNIVLLSLCLMLSACDFTSPSKEPVTLTMWHIYGAQINSPMNAFINKFNQTVGKEHHIKIVVTSISNSTAIHDTLVSAAHNEVGAPELPDIFTCYPKTLEAMGTDVALDWKSYFSDEELQAFVPEFIAEGKFTENGQEKLLVFPVSKSTNALFINAHAYETFAEETGHSYQDLETWEGVFATIEEYRTWSGNKGNEQAFFMYDDWIHYPLLSMQARGENLFKDNTIDWNNPHFKEVMRPLLRAGIRGEVCLMPGYSTKAIMIDKAIAGVESTASVLYFKNSITYNDNSIADLKVKALPVPYFSNTKRLAIQRGTGLVALKSTQAKEEAAALFCKWISSEEINLQFVMLGGYLPTRINNFNKLHSEIEHFAFPRERFRSLYEAIEKIYQDNSFVTTPTFADYGAIEQAFSKALIQVLSENHQVWTESTVKDEVFLNELIERTFALLEKRFPIVLQEWR